MQLSDIQKDWSLFLDRDGVINHDKDNDYIRNWQEFRFYDTTLEALRLLAGKFDTIVIVTNQKGVGRGLMSLADLENIHQHMLKAIRASGGRIDGIYFCSDLDNDSPNRKPNPGMAFQAKKDFPGIVFSKSLIVGNRTSDMAFGRNAGMHTVFLATTHPETAFPDPSIDFRFNHLLEFARACQ
ncbi:MAG TPA: HAD-IIIA family hydrolase [Sediminibacterium sp.]|nr:HAD-IIIA family hydrolase [Sediminibacterium sp.]